MTTEALTDLAQFSSSTAGFPPFLDIELHGIAIRPEDGLAFGIDSNNSDSLHVLDLTSGDIESTVGPTGIFGPKRLVFVVPEPSTLVLSGLGLILLSIRQRSRASARRGDPIRIMLAIALLLLALPGAARAANVDVILSCGGCLTNPDPAILDIGDTLTLTCAPDCGSSGCTVYDNSGGISGCTPFIQTLSPGETGSALGPATARGESAVIFILNDGCYPAFHGSLKTAAEVSTITPFGVVVAAGLMLAMGFNIFSRERPSV